MPHNLSGVMAVNTGTGKFTINTTYKFTESKRLRTEKNFGQNLINSGRNLENNGQNSKSNYSYNLFLECLFTVHKVPLYASNSGTLEVVTIIFGLICLYFQIIIRIFVANL